MKNEFFILALLALFLLCCHKEENDFGLPPATQNGANTFGCLLNGKPWIANIDPGVFDPLIRKTEASYDEVETGGGAPLSYFFVSATFISLADSIKDDFWIHIRPVYNAGMVDFSKINQKSIQLIFSQPGQATHTSLYVVDTLYPINLNIRKLDTAANICSGTFDFRLISKAEKDTLHVTEGRFDMIYQPD